MLEYENLLRYIEVIGKNTLSFILDDDTVNVYGQTYENVNILKLKVLGPYEFNDYDGFIELTKQDPNFEVSISHIGEVTPLDVNIITRMKHITIFDKNCDYLDIIEDKMTPLRKTYDPVDYHDEAGKVLYTLTLERVWFNGKDKDMYHLDVVDHTESVLIKLIYGDIYTSFINIDFNKPDDITAYRITSKNSNRKGTLLYDANVADMGVVSQHCPSYIINILELLNEHNIRFTFNL